MKQIAQRMVKAMSRFRRRVAANAANEAVEDERRPSNGDGSPGDRTESGTKFQRLRPVPAPAVLVFVVGHRGDESVPAASGRKT